MTFQIYDLQQAFFSPLDEFLKMSEKSIIEEYAENVLYLFYRLY